MSKPNPWTTLRARADAFWLARTEQERKLLRIGGIVVGLGLFYSIAIDPAMSGADRLHKELPQLHQQAAEMQGMAREAQALQGQNTIAPTPMTRDNLNAGLAARGLNPQSLNVTGEYAKLQFTGAQYAGIVDWLNAIRTESRINVVDASFTAQDTAGVVNGTLTLRQGAR
ncbi:type II secretion system protein M [Pseudoduganella sp. FT25W]|jgi:general secretion pathway protein M|uniref:Type II secretion system protein M n=1 Tax=Duganella alba TaxID=2666081 RepID=A0A6L5QAN7_9BURK|nr:type II secretion system protein GspM [Duganella alba]MRX06756.1 type II secretion system protein M [Duganella alba]MRX18442.1 type II secretion system protein M [Duganella alba]